MICSATEGDATLKQIHEILGKPRYVICVYEKPGDTGYFHILIHGGLSNRELHEIQLGLADAWSRGELAEGLEG